MKNIMFLFSEEFDIALSLIGTVLVYFLFCRFFRHIENKALQKKSVYLHAFLTASNKPLQVMIWVIGLSMACTILLAHRQALFLSLYLHPLKKTGLILAITWALIDFIRQVEHLLVQSSKDHTKSEKLMDETLMHALGLLFTGVIISIAVISVMQVFALPVAGLLAFGGLGGAGLAFASKDILANFFGGLVIYMDRPFKMGHVIRSPDKNIEGTVERIGWRVTHIRTFDKTLLYVPNSTFLNVSVENISRVSHLHIKTWIAIRYSDADKINALTQAIKNMLLNHSEIDTKQNILVHLTEFGASSLNILMDCFTKNMKTIEYQAARHDILMKVLEIIQTHGAEMALPTQTLFCHSEKDG